MNFRFFALGVLLFASTGCDSAFFSRSSESVDLSAPFELKLLSSESCPLPEHLDPKEVAIASYRVRLTGRHEGNVPVNYFYASLLTTDGSRYLAGLPGCNPVLSAAPLPPGGSYEGFLNFPVPPAKTPEMLVYSPALLGAGAAITTKKIDLLTRDKGPTKLKEGSAE